MAKKSPKLGDEIVDSPATQVVTDPVQIEAALGDLEGPNLTQAAAAGEDVEAILAQLQAEEEAALAPVPTPDPSPTLLLEDGSRVKMEFENSPPAYCCTGRDGLGYYHVSDHPVTSEWVYRYIP